MHGVGGVHEGFSLWWHGSPQQEDANNTPDRQHGRQQKQQIGEHPPGALGGVGGVLQHDDAAGQQHHAYDGKREHCHVCTEKFFKMMVKKCTQLCMMKKCSAEKKRMLKKTCPPET